VLRALTVRSAATLTDDMVLALIETIEAAAAAESVRDRPVGNGQRLLLGFDLGSVDGRRSLRRRHSGGCGGR
jgi:hypothetical protein